MTVALSITKRGLDVAHNYLQQRSDKDPKVHEVSPIAALILFVTVLAGILLISAVAYTYGQLIPILCMIESPSATAYVPIQAVDLAEDAPPAYTEDGVPKPIDDEAGLVRTKPITASLRETVNHLQARAGWRSRFRGLAAFLVLNAAGGTLTTIFSAGSRNPIAKIVASIFAEVALANIHMTWIHIIISEPSSKRWYQRIPKPMFKTWKKMAPAVAIWAFTEAVVLILPLLVTNSFGVLHHMKKPEFQPGMKDAYVGAGQMFFAMLLTVTLFVLLQIPASVAMVRVAASMLPEEDETIVPFDRTFGGLTTPEIIGGQGKIGIVEAWRSFNWECRKRLLRTVVKVGALVMAIYLAFSILIVTEAHVIIGPAFGDMMKGLHGITRGSS